MDKRVRSSLEAGGWKIGTTADFLEESSTESALADITLALADALRTTREGLGLSQAQVAKRLKVGVADLASMELGADRTVTIELLLRALLELGFEPFAIVSMLSDRLEKTHSQAGAGHSLRNGSRATDAGDVRPMAKAVDKSKPRSSRQSLAASRR